MIDIIPIFVIMITQSQDMVINMKCWKAYYLKHNSLERVYVSSSPMTYWDLQSAISLRPKCHIFHLEKVDHLGNPVAF